MAKYKFTQEQFNEIRFLLKRRITESREVQKTTRSKIRKLGFKISDYFNGFNDIDFDKLLKLKEIEIIDRQIYNLESTHNSIVKKTTKNNNTQQNRIPRVNYKDEHYVLDLCDKVLNLISYRQYRFDFLLGDPNSKGIAVKLPVDSFYKELNLVVEYRERQHTETVNFFDKPNKLTVSGVHRGEQRKIYDERRREVLPKYNIHLIEISFSDFSYDNHKRIIRNPNRDIEIIKLKLKQFIS